MLASRAAKKISVLVKFFLLAFKCFRYQKVRVSIFKVSYRFIYWHNFSVTASIRFNCQNEMNSSIDTKLLHAVRKLSQSRRKYNIKPSKHYSWNCDEFLPQLAPLSEGEDLIQLHNAFHCVTPLKKKILSAFTGVFHLKINVSFYYSLPDLGRIIFHGEHLRGIHK